MKAPDEYGINKDFTEKSTDWIVTAGERCTDASDLSPRSSTICEDQASTVAAYV